MVPWGYSQGSTTPLFGIQGNLTNFVSILKTYRNINELTKGNPCWDYSLGIYLGERAHLHCVYSSMYAKDDDTMFESTRSVQ